jgi:hypothetical protein
MCSIYVHMCSVFTPVDNSVEGSLYKGLRISTGHKINMEGHKMNVTGHKINMTGHKINMELWSLTRFFHKAYSFGHII